MKVYKPADPYNGIDKADYGDRFNEDVQSVVSRASWKSNRRHIQVLDQSKAAQKNKAALNEALKRP